MKPKKRISIKSRVFGGFLIFTCVILALLWIFQIAMLDTFYRNIKIKELENSADTLIAAIDSPDLQEVANKISEGNQINILITNENGFGLIVSYYSQSNAIYRGYAAQYAAIYNETVANGGTIFQEYSNQTNSFTPSKEALESDNMVLAKSTTNSLGQNRLILLHSNLTPVDATKTTLEFQLYCITFIMIFLAFILALILAVVITKPIDKINNTAQLLGEGNYGVHFDESGYKEISELARTLNYTTYELSKLEALRRDLIANISHDLRTPLTMIEGYSEVMRDIPNELNSENVQIIIDESHRLTSLVNDMLDLSRLQSGTIPLESETFCITQSVSEIIERYKKLSDINVTFESDFDVYVYADQIKISQVIYNLLNNAVIHSGDEKNITIRQKVNNGFVRIEIIDHGKGIEPEILKDIWERYYKADRTKKNNAGTGLGLSIVKAILDLHKASYGVESQLNKGSNFWFELETVASTITTGH